MKSRFRIHIANQKNTEGAPPSISRGGLAVLSFSSVLQFRVEFRFEVPSFEVGCPVFAVEFEPGSRSPHTSTVRNQESQGDVTFSRGSSSAARFNSLPDSSRSPFRCSANPN